MDDVRGPRGRVPGTQRDPAGGASSWGRASVLGRCWGSGLTGNLGRMKGGRKNLLLAGERPVREE